MCYVSTQKTAHFIDLGKLNLTLTHSKHLKKDRNQPKLDFTVFIVIFENNLLYSIFSLRGE